MNQPVDERFYGRRHGKKIKGTRLFLMENLLPKIQLTEPTNKTQPLDSMSLFNFKPKQLWLEVGFGGGEHLAYQAKQHPDIGFIGAEPFLNGVASLLSHLNGSWGKEAKETPLIEDGRTDNVRIFADDIRKLFPHFKDGFFDRIYVLYPDPWPKSRHEDRRFIGQKNLPELARLLTAKGELRIATDVEQYALWAQEQIEQTGLFHRTNPNTRQPFSDWFSTRYEQKGLKAGRVPTYLVYQKNIK